MWLEQIYGPSNSEEEGVGDGIDEEGGFDYCSNMMHDEAMFTATQLEQVSNHQHILLIYTDTP